MLRQHIRKAGQTPPGIFEFPMQSLGFRSQGPRTGKPPHGVRPLKEALVSIAFGADSVASALHLRLGATPRRRAQIIMTSRASRSKAELLADRRPKES
jgi:hypothetical protein